MGKRPRPAPVDDIVSPVLATPTRPRVYTPDSDTLKLEAAARTESAPTDALFASLSDMVARVASLEADLDEIEEMRKVRAARLRELIEDLIPAALEESGLESFKTSTGVTVSIEDVVTATLGKGRDEEETVHSQRKERALEWLDDNGHDGIIKVSYDVEVPRGDHESDAETRAALERLGVQFSRDVGVHHATLAAFVKGLMANGDAVPLDLFRVAKHKRAKIKAPKGK